MKRRRLFGGAAIIAVVVAMAAVLYNACFAVQGTTVESREGLLNDALSTGTNWSIAKETEVEGYLVSAAYSADSKIALAVFKPDGRGGYAFQSSTNRNADEIVISSVVIHQNSYDLVWFNGAQTAYAELSYRLDDQLQDPLKFDTNDMKIICVKSPAKEYTLSVFYYDHAGNKYE